MDDWRREADNAARVERGDTAGAQRALQLGGESVSAAVDDRAVDDWMESNKYGKEHQRRLYQDDWMESSKNMESSISVAC